MVSEGIGGWEAKPFESVLSIRRGHDLPKRRRVGSGTVPVIGASGPVGEHDESKIHGPTFTIGRSASIGELVWVEGPAWPLNTTLYVTDFHGNDPRFLYYLLHTVDFTAYNSGSVQPMLNRNYVARHVLQVPPLSEQRAIAEVLSSLDARLQHLRRAASLSLKVALAQFDLLPHHSYSLEPVGKVLTVSGGGTPSTSNPDYWDGEHRWLTPRDLSGQEGVPVCATERTLTDAGLAQVSSRLLPRGTVVISSRAPIGHLGILAEPCAINQGFIALSSDDVVPLYIYAWLSQSMEVIKSRAGGSTFAEISKTSFRPIPFPRPSGPEYERFARSATDIMELLVAVEEQVEAVQRTRAALLPELVTGRLRIPDVDGFLERAGLS